MFSQSANFTLSTSGGFTLANLGNISNVAFGLGPDGINKPDGDDIGKGVMVSSCLGGNCGGVSTTPEPGSVVLMGFGLVGLGMLRRIKKGSSIR